MRAQLPAGATVTDPGACSPPAHRDAGRRDGWRRGTRRLHVAPRRGDAALYGMSAFGLAYGL